MICRNCGNNIGDRVVCPYCGMQNQQFQEAVPEKTKKNNNLGPIIIMVIAVIMAIGVFVFVNMNKVKVEENSSNVDTNKISNINTNSSSNIGSNTNEDETLVCTQNLNDDYGTYQSTYEYVFKNNRLSSYKVTTVATLNQDFYSYRDSILRQYDEANVDYKNVSGIMVESQIKGNGFTYIVKIDDLSKVDREKLKTMNLYLVDYSSVKSTASKKGLTCSE